jgi:hypothetical protein
MLRRIRKHMYYTVYLFAATVFALCNCSDKNGIDTPMPLEGTKFDTNHTASVRSITIGVAIDLLNLDPSKFMTYEYRNEGYHDGHNFRVAIFWAESFTVTLEELKLFYNNKKKYLLFKLIEQ